MSNEDVLKQLEGLYKKQRLAHSLLFVGDDGVALDHAVERLAQSLNAEAGIKRVELEGKAKGIKISQIREVSKELSLRPTEGFTHVVHIREAEKMTLDAQNALLKILEEPPKATFFMLTTNFTHGLLATILSRCQKTYFKADEESVEVAGDVIEEVLEWIAEAKSNQATAMFSPKDKTGAEEFCDVLSWVLRDMLLLKVGSVKDVLVCQSWIDQIEVLSQKYSMDELNDLLIYVQNARKDLSNHINPKLILHQLGGALGVTV